MTTRHLPTLLRELREQRGASLRSAAEELGVDPSYLSRLERGQKPASGQIVEKAAALYEVPREMLELAQGRLPDDIISIFRRHPELLEQLRGEYGSH